MDLPAKAVTKAVPSGMPHLGDYWNFLHNVWSNRPSYVNCETENE